MPRHSQRSRTRRRNRGRFGPLFKLLCLIALIVALTGGATVFFRVEQVVVEGNQRYTQEEIIAAAGIQEGDNLYALNKYRMSERLRQTLPYIGEASIRRGLPSTVIITVTEWGAVARIEPPDPGVPLASGEDLEALKGPEEPLPAAAQEGWLINASGKLLEPAPEGSTAPSVTGLTSLEPQAGQMLTVPEGERTRLETLLSLLAALEEEEMLSQVSAIGLSTTRVKLRYLDRFDVRLAPNKDFGYCLQVMQSVEEQISQRHGSESVGTMDLTQEDYDLVYCPG